MKLTLKRQRTGDTGTFGILPLPDHSAVLMTLELPWKDDAPDISCVPSGTYKCIMQLSNHFQKQLYHLQDVPGQKEGDERVNVMIHVGNWAGDKSKGLHSDVEGCIVLGQNVKVLETPEGKMQEGIEHSGAAVARFMDAMGGNPFDLEIVETYGD